MKTELSLENWQFPEPQNLAVITTKQVILENHPILYAFHHEDGDWQFHTGEDLNEENATVVGLREIVNRDSSISDLANLPTGWIATRKSQNDDWQRFKDSRTDRDI